jgi:dTDP-4-amino-4,6-dideoxygalactose transaminase
MISTNRSTELQDRLYLSPPHLGDAEFEYVREAFESNWIAPLGPNVDGFEREFCETTGAAHAAALTSGTAALHLSLILSDIGPEDTVLVSSLTFSASVNPIRYVGATPVFIDSERASWNLDPNLLEDELKRRAERGDLPKALIAVHLYGQCADMDPIVELCERYDVVLIEDAAEALGAKYWGSGENGKNGKSGKRMGGGEDGQDHSNTESSNHPLAQSSYPYKSPGTFGRFGIFSFNGNKIITTSGGGMLVSDDEALIRHARKLATQARDDAPHYEHSEIGYNYRMSNVVAGIGRGQLEVLGDRVESRRRNFAYYEKHLGDLPGITFQPEAEWGLHNRWLTCLTIEPDAFGASREDVRLALEAENIEARPVWKPMHMQPVFREFPVVGGAVSEELFEKGLCLPSGSSMTEDDLARVVEVVRRCGG